jgi:hypothetical protein
MRHEKPAAADAHGYPDSRLLMARRTYEMLCPVKRGDRRRRHLSQDQTLSQTSQLCHYGGDDSQPCAIIWPSSSIWDTGPYGRCHGGLPFRSQSLIDSSTPAGGWRLDVCKVKNTIHENVPVSCCLQDQVSDGDGRRQEVGLYHEAFFETSEMSRDFVKEMGGGSMQKAAAEVWTKKS